MYLNKLKISGYKNFDKDFSINLNEGLNVLIGENGVGKSAIIDAIRMILLEDEFGRTSVSDTDFHREFSKSATPSKNIKIKALFHNLTQEEQVAFLPWTELGDTASLSLQIDNKENSRGRYKRFVWGGVSQNTIFEWDLLNTIPCVYLPPLRDAEAKLREGRGSRLARLMRNLNINELEEARRNDERHPLEAEVFEFNQKLASSEFGNIADARKKINDSLREALGIVFAQDTTLQFSEVNFNRIVESLRLLFFPDLQIPETDR